MTCFWENSVEPSFDPLRSAARSVPYLVMYSFGILGSWWLKMFCSAIIHSMMFFGTLSVNELEIT